MDKCGFLGSPSSTAATEHRRTEPITENTVRTATSTATAYAAVQNNGTWLSKLAS